MTREDNRKPTGVRVLATEEDGKSVFFMYPTAKSGDAQNSRHTIIKSRDSFVVNRRDPAEIGKAVLATLGLDKHDKTKR